MARRDGWRSRAVYKLEQILQKERLLRPDLVCIDLGAAPGGWSQYLSERLKGRGRILALDLLPMDSVPCVEFVQGDFTEDAVLGELLGRLGDDRADLVLSDMAPNISGNKAVDSPGRFIWLNSHWISRKRCCEKRVVLSANCSRERARTRW
jgi:23S rRNA (uridine2552-2'-O)-methyltransferase